MKTWLAIFLFAGLTFLALGIRPYVYDSFIGFLLGNSHYIYLILLIYFSKIKETTFLKALFYFILISHFALDLLVFFEMKILNDVFVITINLIFFTIFFVTFVLAYKKRGSGFYTEKITDWLVAFPIGLTSFLTILFLFYGRVQPKFEAILILLAFFISLYYILGVNTPMKKKNYIIHLFGLFINFITLNIALYVFQVEPFEGGEVIMKGLFVTGFYCQLEALYQISDVLYRK